MMECIENINDYEFYYETCYLQTSLLGNIKILKVISYYDDVLSMLGKNNNNFYFLSGAKELFEKDSKKYKRIYNMVEMTEEIYKNFINNIYDMRQIFKIGNLYKIELQDDKEDILTKINYEDLEELDLPIKNCKITTFCDLEELKQFINYKVNI